MMRKFGLIPSIITIGTLAFSSLACGNTNKESNPQTSTVTEVTLSMEEQRDLMNNIRERFVQRALECDQAVTYYSFYSMDSFDPYYLMRVLDYRVLVNVVGIDIALKDYDINDEDVILDHLVDHEMRHLCIAKIGDLVLPKEVSYGPHLSVMKFSGMIMELNDGQFDTTMEEGLVHLLSVLKSKFTRPDFDFNSLSPTYELLSRMMNDLLEIRGIDANALAQQYVLDYEQLRIDILGIHGEATDDYDAIIRTWVDILEKFGKDPSTYYQGAFQEQYELNR